ncbi:hypothetical protein ACVGWC_07240, partial [Enterobacter hormaechei]
AHPAHTGRRKYRFPERITVRRAGKRSATRRKAAQITKQHPTRKVPAVVPIVPSRSAPLTLQLNNKNKT